MRERLPAPKKTVGRPISTERHRIIRRTMLRAVLSVIATEGLGRLTHRRVAKAAGVSLSSTTYHFTSKAEMLHEARAALLRRSMAFVSTSRRRYRDAGVTDADTVLRAILVDLTGRYRTGSITFCELLLDAIRDPEARERFDDLFHQMENASIRLLSDLAVSRDDRDAITLIDKGLGLLLMFHGMGFEADTVAEVMAGDMRPVERLIDHAPDPFRTTERPLAAKAQRSRQAILANAVDIMVREGADALTYQAIAAATGVAPSTPHYYFPSIGYLLNATQHEIFAASKRRYREANLHPDELSSPHTLVDFTHTVFLREASGYSHVALAHYSIWLEGSRRAELRSQVASTVLDQTRAWERRLDDIGFAPPIEGLGMLAIFTGKLVRAIATGAQVKTLIRSREEFRMAIERGEDMLQHA